MFEEDEDKIEMKHEVAGRFLDIAKEKLGSGLELNVGMTPSAVRLSNYKWEGSECIESTSLYFFAETQSFYLEAEVFKNEEAAVHEFLRRVEK